MNVVCVCNCSEMKWTPQQLRLCYVQCLSFFLDFRRLFYVLHPMFSIWIFHTSCCCCWSEVAAECIRSLTCSPYFQTCLQLQRETQREYRGRWAAEQQKMKKKGQKYIIASQYILYFVNYSMLGDDLFTQTFVHDRKLSADHTHTHTGTNHMTQHDQKKKLRKEKWSFVVNLFSARP